MHLTIRLFARLREQIGTGEERLEVPDQLRNLAMLREWLAERGGAWQDIAAGEKVLGAVNEEMASDTTTIQDGDVVAFFPPVTGG